jgi:hypothetical protein
VPCYRGWRSTRVIFKRETYQLESYNRHGLPLSSGHNTVINRKPQDKNGKYTTCGRNDLCDTSSPLPVPADEVLLRCRENESFHSNSVASVRRWLIAARCLSVINAACALSSIVYFWPILLPDSTATRFRRIVYDENDSYCSCTYIS